jgi:uncharacterized delta-60 repeat protein
MLLCGLGMLLAFASVASDPASGASSGTTVSATVPSATSLDVAGCGSGVAGKTHFGNVMPGSSSVTNLDCAVQFGSSNDTAMVRIAQADASGVAMFSTSRGVIDNGFGTDGVQSTKIAPGTEDQQVTAMAVQPDGKPILVGFCRMAVGTNYDFCMARYTTAGAPDPTFDTDGIVTTGIAPGNESDFARAVLVQADGKIVVAGTCYMGDASRQDFCLARYTAAGALDPTYGVGGIVVNQMSECACYDGVRAATLQADGKVVVVGECDTNGPSGYDICVARYTTSGALDSTFDYDGKVFVAINPGANTDWAYSVLQQPDGRIVVGGNCDIGAPSGQDFCTVRLMGNGALDITFDGDGIAVTPVGPGASSDWAGYVLLQPDGKIINVGDCSMGAGNGLDTCIVRYTSTGALDPTFGIGGIAASARPGSDYAHGAALEPDGRIVVTGVCGGDFCTMRFNASGEIDTTFGTAGFQVTSIAPGANDDFGRAMAFGPDGRLYVGGFCNMGGATGRVHCLARYRANGTIADYANGITDWDQGGSAFGACLASVAGGATAQWIPSACIAVDGASWNPVATAATKVAYTASAGTTAATINLRFGLRAAASQATGSYVAPINFEVLAPNA